VADRNPIWDPLPGDVLEGGAPPKQLHVHAVKDGQVFAGKWTATGESLGMVRGDMEQWRQDCALAGAQVIQRHEECSAEVLAELEVPHA
jgi:hypothetical protein